MSRLIKQFIVLAVISFIFTPLASHAVTKADWRAGNIVDDAIFYNGGDLSVADIQNFLNNKVNCDTWGTKRSEHGGGTRAQYGASRGHPAPYTCLKSYSQGGKSSAQIIKEAASTHGISARALIVLLQKEQALVTDEWPWSNQYRSATGYGCPDTAPCDAEYFGFRNQVMKAASQFKRYSTQSSSYRYKPYQSNYIQYNPVASCGGTNVHVSNLATAGLYNYTPYQPNASSLNNLYGSGDGCGAYGNRNFWRLFNDWFGSTGASPFFQVSGSPKTYVIGAGNTYYSIDDYSRLLDYGFETKFGRRVDQVSQSSLNGKVLKGSLPAVVRFDSGPGIFVPQSGSIKPFPSEKIFYAYGYDFGQEAVLPAWLKNSLTEVQPMQQVLKVSGSPTVYFVESGKKHPFCNEKAYTQLGSPVYSSRPTATLNSYYPSKIPVGSPMAAEGDLIISSDTKQYGVWQNGVYVPMRSDVAANSGALSCGVPAASVNQLPKSTAVIANLVKDSQNNNYVLDGSKKLAVSASAASAYGIPPSKHQAVSNALLAKLSTQPLKSLIRVSNTPAVYEVKNGNSYPVASEKDLYGLGYSFANVQVVSKPTLDLTKKSGLLFSSGRLVREYSSKGVFLVNSSSMEKYAFTSEAQFYNYGFSFNSVAVVPNGGLSAYSSAGAISHFILEDDGNYWLMDRGVKRRITGDLPSSANYNAVGRATPLPAITLSKFPMTTALTKVFRANNGRGVYLIENGSKRVFASEKALFSRGYNWNNVIVLSPYFVNSLPSGSPIY